MASISGMTVRLILILSGRTLERLVLEVSDTGQGIPDDVMARVFEPLFSTRTFGVGLGLPTVRQIVEQHGGVVEISSREGHGTTVEVWLPVSDQEEAPGS